MRPWTWRHQPLLQLLTSSLSKARLNAIKALTMLAEAPEEPQAPAVPRGHLPGARGGPQPGRAAGGADSAIKVIEWKPESPTPPPAHVTPHPNKRTGSLYLGPNGGTRWVWSGSHVSSFLPKGKHRLGGGLGHRLTWGPGDGWEASLHPLLQSRPLGGQRQG